MSTRESKLSVFHAPLKPQDSAIQTEGCRHTNPDICASHSLPKVCAFVRKDRLCLKPPASWAKQFKYLSENSLDAKES